jgi:hypothetical protein
MDQFATKASGGLKMSENEAESPLAQEISAILVNHPEYYDEIRAHIGEVFAKPNA